MKFQRERDTESLLIEKRSAELAAAGYPLLIHDTAMDAEDIIRTVKQARGRLLEQSNIDSSLTENSSPTF
ncbi:hypothetical protein [Pseudomonas frederiksbergensis]|nr:hypothetical protein [Pseudomonas frederiksbergensis]